MSKGEEGEVAAGTVIVVPLKDVPEFDNEFRAKLDLAWQKRTKTGIFSGKGRSDDIARGLRPEVRDQGRWLGVRDQRSALTRDALSGRVSKLLLKYVIGR